MLARAQYMLRHARILSNTVERERERERERKNKERDEGYRHINTHICITVAQ